MQLLWDAQVRSVELPWTMSLESKLQRKKPATEGLFPGPIPSMK